MPWETIIPGDGDNRLPGAIAKSDEPIQKKPVLQALFDMLEKAGEPRYNPSGFRDRAMIEEDDTRMQKIVCLLELLNNTAFPKRQHRTLIKRLRGLMSACAFPGIDYYELIQSLMKTEKETSETITQSR